MSPELALVDAELAAQLRADMPTDEAFRPRVTARPEYLTLVFDAVVRDLADDDLPADEPSVDELDEIPVVEDEAPVAEWASLPDFIVPSDDVVDVDVEHETAADVADDAQSEPSHASADAFEPPALEALPDLDEQAFALPDYVVVNDDNPDDLPDYIVQSEEERAVVQDAIAPAVDENVENVLPDYLVHHDELVTDAVGEDSADDAGSRSAYPVLPDLDERSDALEETEAALRRIREQLVVPPPVQRRPRVRRRFTVAAGLCAVAAVATFAVEVQLGVTHVPGFLAF